MLRPVLIVFGIVIAAVGGVIAYRAYFLDPATAFVVSEEGVRELPDYFKVITGIVLLVVGAALSITVASRRRKP